MMDIKKELIIENKKLLLILKKKFLHDHINNREDNFRNHCLLLYLGKILSLTKSICLLSSYSRGEEASILVRSLLETMLYILFLLKYTDKRISKLVYFYGSHYLYKNMLKDKFCKIYKNIPYSKDLLEQNSLLEKEYQNAKKEYVKAREKLFRDQKFQDKNDSILGLNNRDIAGLVGLEDCYDYIYWMLSSMTHPNMAGLKTRVTMTEDGYDVSLDKTEQECTSALFYTFDINTYLLKELYKNQTHDKIFQKYMHLRDTFSIKAIKDYAPI